METLEVWQIRLAVLLFLTFTDWLGYVFLSYCLFKVKPKCLWQSLSVPIVLGIIFYATGFLSGTVSQDVAMTLLILAFSMAPYLVFFAIDSRIAVKGNGEGILRNIVLVFFCFAMVLLQFVPLAVYANNIRDYSFRRESADVIFPEILCHPSAINTVVIGNGMKHQVWSEYSSFTISGKRLAPHSFIVCPCNRKIEAKSLSWRKRGVSRE